MIKEKRIDYFPGIFRHFFLFWKVVIKVAHIRYLWSMNSALYLQSKSLDSSSIQREWNTASWKHLKKIALFSQYSAEKPPVFTQLYSCSVLWRGLLTMDSFGLGIGYVFVLFGPAHTR